MLIAIMSINCSVLSVAASMTMCSICATGEEEDKTMPLAGFLWINEATGSFQKANKMLQEVRR